MMLFKEWLKETELIEEIHNHVWNLIFLEGLMLCEGEDVTRAGQIIQWNAQMNRWNRLPEEAKEAGLNKEELRNKLHDAENTLVGLRDRVFRTAYKRTKDDSLADDITQEIFSYVYRVLTQTDRSINNLGAYLSILVPLKSKALLSKRHHDVNIPSLIKGQDPGGLTGRKGMYRPFKQPKPSAFPAGKSLQGRLPYKMPDTEIMAREEKAMLIRSLNELAQKGPREEREAHFLVCHFALGNSLRQCTFAWNQKKALSYKNTLNRTKETLLKQSGGLTTFALTKILANVDEIDRLLGLQLQRMKTLPSDLIERADLSAFYPGSTIDSTQPLEVMREMGWSSVSSDMETTKNRLNALTREIKILAQQLPENLSTLAQKLLPPKPTSELNSQNVTFKGKKSLIRTMRHSNAI